jgi:polysaccharide biosynthesis/export protein
VTTKPRSRWLKTFVMWKFTSWARRGLGRTSDAAGMHRCGLFGLGLVAVAVTCPFAPLRAEYRVDVGDVIEISVARVPELQRRATVNSDGDIAFPLLGTFPVAGLLPSEMEARIQATLATRAFRQRASDGREYTVEIDPDEVTAVVALHRPIYVNGDVLKPGDQAFRPFMTVREAVALSGGYDVLRVRLENPILLAADLKGEYQSLWTEFTKQQAQALRLEAELAGKDTFDKKFLAETPLPPSKTAEIAATEAERLRTEQVDYDREKAFLELSFNQNREQIKVLAEQEAKQQEGMQADAEELRKLTELLGKGMLLSARVTEARRAMLLSSTMALQTAAQLMQMKRQQAEVARQLVRLGDQRRIKLLQELQEARTTLSQVRAKLQSTGEKLEYAGARSQLMRGNELRPEIVLIRKGEKGRERIAANEDSELQPGDVVEVVLRSDDMTGKDMQAAGSPVEVPAAVAARPMAPPPTVAAPALATRLLEPKSE